MQALATATKSRVRQAGNGSKRPEVTDSANEILTQLPVVMDFFRKHMRSSRAKGLSVPQFRVLVRIERKGTLSDVAACLGITLPTASRIVSKLVAKNYLRRVECDQDRRVRQLSLTPDGRRVLENAYDATRQVMETELKQLTEADCREIANSLRLLGKVFTDERAV